MAILWSYISHIVSILWSYRSHIGVILWSPWWSYSHFVVFLCYLTVIFEAWTHSDTVLPVQWSECWRGQHTVTDCKYSVKIYYYHALCTLLLSLTCLFQFSIRIELNIFIIEAFVLNSPPHIAWCIVLCSAGWAATHHNYKTQKRLMTKFFISEKRLEQKERQKSSCSGNINEFLKVTDQAKTVKTRAEVNANFMKINSIYIKH